ncbi:hypothetical protein [Chlamydia sp.]|uniref:hypothetical protein n=1 Tax=Chlamydia sp. TaxID=35827 RepID=UPI0025BF811F|nr:hypothetical protein [Chlamydia sp.]MBQ8498852.1 hypothetical protein [Chlamydia sp.]
MDRLSQVHQELARLEFINDQLQSERAYIHNLLCAIGFPEGLKTIAAIANEVLAEEDPQG